MPTGPGISTDLLVDALRCPECGVSAGHRSTCLTGHRAEALAEPPAHDDNLPKNRDSVCRICGDTHVMDHGDRQVPCIFCPMPCQLCRGSFSAYCTFTPCACACHASKTPNTPEPPPKPGVARATWSLVMADMLERDATGAAKYGVRHQHDNGRDHLIDAYQEALDLALYLRAEIEKRKAVTP